MRAKPCCFGLAHILSRLPASCQAPQNRIQTAHIAEAIHLRSPQAAGIVPQVQGCLAFDRGAVSICNVRIG